MSACRFNFRSLCTEGGFNIFRFTNALGATSIDVVLIKCKKFQNAVHGRGTPIDVTTSECPLQLAVQSGGIPPVYQVGTFTAGLQEGAEGPEFAALPNAAKFRYPLHFVSCGGFTAPPTASMTIKFDSLNADPSAVNFLGVKRPITSDNVEATLKVTINFGKFAIVLVFFFYSKA